MPQINSPQMMSNDSNITRWQAFCVEVLWYLCRGFALLPRVVRHYVVGYPIYLLMHYVIRYRRKVVMHNLRNAFPEKSDKELRQICRDVTRNLTEQIINTIDKAGLGRKGLLKRINIIGIDEVREQTSGRSMVFLTAHYGPWEMGTTISYGMPEYEIMAVYHPLKNRVVDELMKRIRKHDGVAMVPMQQTMRYFISNHQKQPLIVGLIADQNPKTRAGQPWFRFMNQWTAFFDGAETIALKYHLPVYYFSPKRIKAGIYEARITLLYDGVEQVAENVITERYIRALEQDIMAHPGLWMWTHKRWKKKPPQEILDQEI